MQSNVFLKLYKFVLLKNFEIFFFKYFYFSVSLFSDLIDQKTGVQPTHSAKIHDICQMSQPAAFIYTQNENKYYK